MAGGWVREVAAHLLSFFSCPWRCFVSSSTQSRASPEGGKRGGEIKQHQGQGKKLNKWAVTSRIQRSRASPAHVFYLLLFFPRPNLERLLRTSCMQRAVCRYVIVREYVMKTHVCMYENADVRVRAYEWAYIYKTKRLAQRLANNFSWFFWDF